MEQAARGLDGERGAGRAAERGRGGTGERRAGPGAGVGPDEGVRGGHGHSETPVPHPGAGAVPRKVPQRHSVRGQVLAALRTALVGGDLVPGGVYSAPALAESLGVSATPVREAMQQLAIEGAVEVVPNRGFRVAERSARDLAELAEVRALLEVPVILGLLRTLPPERWEELRPLAAATVRTAARGDRVGYADADRAFHQALLEPAGNRQLMLVGADLHRRAQGPTRGGGPLRTADLLADAAEHTALLDALVAGDGATAERLLRAHL